MRSVESIAFKFGLVVARLGLDSRSTTIGEVFDAADGDALVAFGSNVVVRKYRWDNNHVFFEYKHYRFDIFGKSAVHLRLRVTRGRQNPLYDDVVDRDSKLSDLVSIPALDERYSELRKADAARSNYKRQRATEIASNLDAICPKSIEVDGILFKRNDNVIAQKAMHAAERPMTVKYSADISQRRYFVYWGTPEIQRCFGDNAKLKLVDPIIGYVNIDENGRTIPRRYENTTSSLAQIHRLTGVTAANTLKQILARAAAVINRKLARS